jgi:pimeloyl-ACP methyl ester carboxylesterase
LASILAAARYRTSAAVLILLAAAALAGCSTSHTSNAAAGTPAALAQFYDQQLDWSDCKRSFQCARLTVPVNYADPTGHTITLAVIRAQATDPAHRIGSLLTNPGGPGGSGVEFFEQSYPSRPGRPSVFDPQLRADFDIVGFDPRGVGDSAPVTCLGDAALDRYTALNPNPTTPEQIQNQVAADKAYVAGCQRRSDDLLPFVGTPNAARDMDVLRAALGDQKMYYLGYSYGTYLGAVYAELFPSRVGRFVLDGPLPPDLTNRMMDVQQAKGFQVEVNRFLADCVTHPDCPMGTDPATAATALSNFFAAAQQNPVPTDSSRTVNAALAQTGVLYALYDSPTSWPALRKALADAMMGRGRALLALADGYNERRKDGHYSNSNESNVAINCLDHPDDVHSPADVQAELPAYQQASPTFGAGDAWADLLCAYWPVPAQSQPHQVHYTGTPPILVVGNTDDPATPYPGAQDMASQLGSAVLLTYRSDGHTAYGRGSTCINDAVDQYLTNGTPPSAGTVCQPDQVPAR